MSRLVVRMLTPRLLLLIVLFTQPALVLAAPPGGAAPETIVTPEQVTKTSSADVTVPSNTTYRKARATTMKKGGLETASPSAASLKNESQGTLGPSGAPTPICPINDSKCPDVNGMNGGVKLTAAQIAANCPEVCSVSRTGSLTTGDTFPVCPSGYAQIGSYNVQKEWVADPSGGAWTPQPTNNPATFKTYWDNKAKYRCSATFEAYGNDNPNGENGWACLPYTGDEFLGNPINYDVLWWDQCVTANHGSQTCWGMNNNGDQPGVAAGIFPLWNSFSINNALAAHLKVSGLFNSILAANKVPAVWAAMDNQNMPSNARSGQFETPGVSVPGYCRFKLYGVCIANQQAHTLIKTYSDSACQNMAMKKATCGQTLMGDEPDHVAVERNFSGSTCNPLYIKVKIPVFSLVCSVQGPSLKESGRTIPTSLLCGRIKPTWQ